MVFDVTGGNSPLLLPQAVSKISKSLKLRNAAASCQLNGLMQTSSKLLFSLLLVRSNKQLDGITEKLMGKEEEKRVQED